MHGRKFLAGYVDSKSLPHALDDRFSCKGSMNPLCRELSCHHVKHGDILVSQDT